MIHAAVDRAARWHVTVYDAAYVALAQELGARLVTADRALHATVTSLRYSTFLAELVVRQFA